MNPFTLLWIEIVKRPIFNVLILLLSLFGGNLGRSVIVLTLIIRLLLVRNSMAAMNMQSQMGDMQPKMKEIQDKYADDPERMSKEMMNMFKKDGGGPLKGCLTMLIQIPVFLGLFFTVKEISMGVVTMPVYSFLTGLSVDLTAIDTVFYGIDLLAINNIILTGLASVLMYFQMKVTTLVKPVKAPNLGALGGGENMPDMSKMMGFMNIFFVVMMGGFVWTMPAAIGLYITTTTLFGVVQQVYQYRLFFIAKWNAFRGIPDIIDGN